MTKRKPEDLKALVDTAQEAEADRDRHRMEEAVLATVAKIEVYDPFAQEFYDAFGDLSFTRDDLAAIAKAVFDLMTLGIKATDILVGQRLPKPARVSGDVLKGIFDGSKAEDPSAAREYIGKMIAQDKRRRAQDAGREFMAKVEADKVDEAVDDLSNFVHDLMTKHNLVMTHPTEAVAAGGFLAALNARRKDGRDYVGLSAGFKHLNEVLNGMDGVIILSGAPSTGKTSLAKQIADHVAHYEQVPVLFFSFEQSAEELRIKSLARLSRVNSRVIQKGRSDDASWSEVQKADEAYRRGPGPYLTIIEADEKTGIGTIRRNALIAKRRTGEDKPVLVVIDYLQIIPPPQGVRLDGIKAVVDWNLSELRRLSRDLKSPVLAISSLNRDGYKGNPKPTLAAMKESGGVEYSADVVISLYRNKDETKRMETDRLTRTPDDPKKIRVEAHILKNRNGELAKVLLDFTPAWAAFDEGRKEDLDYFAALGDKSS